ncbi:MAG: hypothetical protein ACI8RD_001567 [Bacillariaceae sp.]|jgi:hypothetical protein
MRLEENKLVVMSNKYMFHSHCSLMIYETVCCSCRHILVPYYNKLERCIFSPFMYIIMATLFVGETSHQIGDM